MAGRGSGVSSFQSMTRQSADSGARTVFLVDGWMSFRRSLRLFLEATGHRVVGEADRVARAAEMGDLRATDVVVLEPRLDWPHLERDLTTLRLAAPAAGVVLLSSEPVPAQLVLRAVESGVSAYLTKRDGPAELLHAIEAALSREFVMLPRRLLAEAPVRRVYVKASLEQARAAERLHLTRRELEILSLAAASRSTREIAQVLFVTDQTVRFHLDNIYRRLGVTTRADAIAAANRLGVLGWEGGQAA